MAPHRPDRPDDPVAATAGMRAPRGSVTWGFTASLDGFITGPEHDMAWLEACPPMDGEVVARLADVAQLLDDRVDLS